ncbi:MAG: hypothetical protein V3T72_12595 [Thermoanaerobaculia bacterium]
MKRFAISFLLSSILAGGAAFAQKQPATALMAVDAAGNLGGDLDEPAGVPDTILTVDISGVEVWGPLGDPDNTILTACLGEGAFLTGIGWDVILTTNGTSWLSEAVTYFDASDQDGSGLFLIACAPNPMPGTMTCDSGGILDLTDNGIPNIEILDDGLLYMEFFDSFDDFPGAPDAVYEDGSFYDLAVLNFSCNLLDIPTLDSAGLIALALLLAAGGALLLKRRLRHHQA